MVDGRRDGASGLLKRALGRIATTTPEIEAEELRRDAAAAGCEPIARCGDREVVTLHGTLRSVTLRPRGGVAALEAELYDGSGTVTLVWLGRRRIGGVAPGRQLTVTGRVGTHGDQRVLYNPRYELSA
jgi:hypothetical protein